MSITRKESWRDARLASFTGRMAGRPKIVAVGGDTTRRAVDLTER